MPALTWDSNLAGVPLTWDSPLGLTWEGLAPVITTNQPMASDNRISIEITPTQKTAIVDAVAALKAALQGITINLTADEKQSLPRIADRTLAFDEKCAAYMTSRPELIPGFLDMVEMARDRKLVADLLPCLLEIAQIHEGLEDTVMLANSDNYVGDLAFYQNVRQAARRGVSGTDTIYNDLKERFPGRPRIDPPTPPTP
ncbi:MAG: hypothetical protein ABMA13_21315 [Chthoniobacteraceae bacterium]